ncbi:helix-turn-helix domain-containing protein [Paenibacillus dendritiformis]|uniref:helix-turn-helix domain-containing protein n=1 Tax=Paenibacillus dendritiformis TaxID=130049 RepID=UPI000DAA8C83|nr:hypothetical protein DOE73_20585 [Paenibacillus dendritiformis]
MSIILHVRVDFVLFLLYDIEEVKYMLTFEPLRKWFTSKDKNRTEMYKTCGFAPTTVAKIWDDRFPVRSDVIEKICRTYNLRIEQVIEYKEDE